MSLPYSRAPHARGTSGVQPEAPNAALLIDFDNVTMGMRSDLSKELKNLLNSDIIKGKVTVQRAYADWRRYPQYIVPLSENSVDLIFAPAYGSSKKNATDIRMAIDGMELVFIRPEIGTFILLTGDSDFSSLVLKLKEYGKYVIGVGIQESSSDILVQNCDEYYSYTSITGLRKTTDSANKPVDPWVLVEKAVERMAARDDVMRSDRLKQVMMEIDPTFDEGNFGFSKFSRFLSEAASRDLVNLRKLDNGQYEVRPWGGGRDGGGKEKGAPQRKADARDHRGREKADGGAHGKGKPQAREATKAAAEVPETQKPKPAPETSESGDPLQAAYDLLRKALGALTQGNGEGPARDSDLKRKMLELDPAFDEGELGFGKFSRFLRQAHDHEVVDLEKREEGTYQVSLRTSGGRAVAAPMESGEKATPATGRQKGEAPVADSDQPSDETLPEEEFGKKKAAQSKPVKGLGPRRGERRGRRGQDGPPPLLEGQVVPAPGEASAEGAAGARDGGKGDDAGPPKREAKAKGGSHEAADTLDPGKLGLPTDGPAIIRYLTNSYKGVGKKTAESLVEAFDSEVFQVLTDEPGRIESVVPGKRAEQLLEAWEADLERRAGKAEGNPDESKDSPDPTPESSDPSDSSDSQDAKKGRQSSLSRRRTRRGGRSRKG